MNQSKYTFGYPEFEGPEGFKRFIYCMRAVLSPEDFYTYCMIEAQQKPEYRQRLLEEVAKTDIPNKPCGIKIAKKKSIKRLQKKAKRNNKFSTEAGNE